MTNHLPAKRPAEAVSWVEYAHGIGPTFHRSDIWWENALLTRLGLELVTDRRKLFARRFLSDWAPADRPAVERIAVDQLYWCEALCNGMRPDDVVRWIHGMDEYNRLVAKRKTRRE